MAASITIAETTAALAAPLTLFIANPHSMPCVTQRKRAVSGTPPEIALTLQIRIVFAEDGLCRKPPLATRPRYPPQVELYIRKPAHANAFPLGYVDGLAGPRYNGPQSSGGVMNRRGGPDPGT